MMQINVVSVLVLVLAAGTGLTLTLLDRLRPGEGRPGSAGLFRRRELGGPDRAARHHRANVADRPV